MIFVIVGFRTDVANSVYYGKASTLQGCLNKVAQAFDKGAQFISLRKIEDK